MLLLAYRNLTQSRIRLVVSTGGVALAFVLILILDAIFVGVERQVTAYMDNAEADVFVSQPGVRNLHMASSWIPGSTVSDVAGVSGVTSVTPILFLENPVTIGQNRYPTYVIGLPPDAAVGIPWDLRDGKANPDVGETVIDAGIANDGGVTLGDTVTIMGQPFTIAGLSEGTANLVSSISFISSADFARIRGTSSAVSFVLAEIAPDQKPEEIAARIESDLGVVTAQSRKQFAEQERKVVRDMATDLVAIMNIAGLMIGLAVMALTIYTATLARRAEFGVVKALGAENRYLYLVVLVQAFFTVTIGLAFSLAITLLLSQIVSYAQPNLVLTLSSESILKLTVMAFAIVGVAAIVPIRQIARLDPAMVFRKAS